MRIRAATAADAALVAHLHAESWRSAYAGLLDPGYLAGPVDAERLSRWTERLARPTAGVAVMLAEENRETLGFACALGGADPRWGTLVDNLHVRPGRRGGGVGRVLLDSVARWSIGTDPEAALHLWCLDGNGPARRFYARCGGTVVERDIHAMRDGGALPSLRFVWSDPRTLVSAAAQAAPA